MTEIDQYTEFSDEGDGCVFRTEISNERERHFVHVQYGLPDSLGSHDSPDHDLQSVTGVLARAVEDRGVHDVCTVDEPLVRGFEAHWLRVEAVRAFLDRRARVRVETATLSSDQVKAIDEFNAAINRWLDGCEEVAAAG